MKRSDAPDAARLIKALLTSTKLKTMEEIYERISPGSDGRIRTECSVVGTETGRFSHSDSFLYEGASTNLGNLPKKTAAASPLYNVRECIIPSEGMVFLEVDLSQAEARAVAGYAKDHETLAVFNTPGSDIHRWTAAKIFKVAEEEVTKSQRHLGKMARHALNYGMGWRLFKERINKDADITGVSVTAARAREVVEGYHEDNPKLLQWWKQIYDEVMATNQLTNCFGRRREFHSPSPRPTDINAYLPQSTVADILNNALGVILDKLDPWLVKIVHQVHDSVLMECKKEDLMDAARAVVDIVGCTLDLDGVEVAFPADAEWSEESWGRMKTLQL